MIDLVATEYKIPGKELYIKARKFYGDTPTSWGVYDRMDAVYSKKKKEFEYEPMPSSRTNKWLKEHRFDSLEEIKALFCKE